MAAAAVAEKAIDVAANVAEDVAEESTQVAEVARGLSPKVVALIGSGTLFGVGVGSFGTWLLMHKALKTKYEELLDQEVEQMREHYLARVRALENEREKEKLDQLREEVTEAAEGGEDGGGKTLYHQMYQPSEDGADTEGNPNVVQNVFVQASEDPEVVMEDGWNYDVEVAQRSPLVPYVIHRDERSEAPDEYEHYTLTYFEGDDVLCKDDDSILDDKDAAVGLGNLARFGHGSGDPNIVYIRNDELKVVLEVVHSDGTYAMEVHGLSPADELKHSSMRRRSPRRSEYDADA